ncbi:MAG: hypothetical protein J5X22_12795 [Candidatus Accumulibacter sp.]|nr:hypothetical protein [Accumulibacter sp.]
MEFEAHGQVAPAVEKNEEKTSKRPENRQIQAFFMPKSKICRFPGLQVRQAARQLVGGLGHQPPLEPRVIEFVYARLTLALSGGNCHRAGWTAASDFVNRRLTLVAPTT